MDHCAESIPPLHWTRSLTDLEEGVNQAHIEVERPTTILPGSQ